MEPLGSLTVVKVVVAAVIAATTEPREAVGGEGERGWVSDMRHTYAPRKHVAMHAVRPRK